MKRYLCLILAALFLLGACSFAPGKGETTVFYYCRTEYAYGDTQGVIAPEHREVSEYASNLSNLLALYLVGPLDEELTSPFLGTRLLSVGEQNGELLIRLAEGETAMSDAAFSLACACMTMTCMELMELNQVTITCGDRSATMRQENLLLYDNITSTETISEEPQ